MSEWISIEKGPPPRLGALLLVFTPSVNVTMRYRICGTDSLRTLSEATHWQYLSPPEEYFSGTDKAEGK